MPKTKSKVVRSRPRAARPNEKRPQTRVRLDPEQLAAVHDRASKLGMTVTGYLQSIIVSDLYPPGIRQIGRAMTDCAEIVTRALAVSDWDETLQSRELTLKVLANVLMAEFAGRLPPKDYPEDPNDPDTEAFLLTRLSLTRGKNQ